MKNISKKVVALVVAAVVIILMISCRAFACEYKCAECLKIEREQFIKNNYAEFLSVREEFGHYMVDYTDNGFVMRNYPNSEVEFNIVFDMINDTAYGTYDGEEFKEEVCYEDYLF